MKKIPVSPENFVSLNLKYLTIFSTPEQVEKYASCTLLSVSMESPTEIDSCIKFLEENEFIRLQHSDSGLRYSATQLGKFFQFKIYPFFVKEAVGKCIKL